MKKDKRQEKAPQTGYKLFIDDGRSPNEIYSGIDGEGWVIARTTREAMEHVSKNGMPFFMSLDYDLGTEDNTVKFLLWLIQQNLDERVPGKVPAYKIHVDDSVGSKSIKSKMDSWKRVAGT